MSKLLDDLNWRYAAKSFDPSKKLTEDQVNTLAESLRLSASSFGLQPWKFIFVSNQETKNKLLAQSWNQAQVTECSHHIVLCYQDNFGDDDVDRFLKSTADARNVGVETLEGFGKVMKGFLSSKDLDQKHTWMKDQVYLALGSLLVVCAEMRIDACPMEGINQNEYDKILGLDKTGWKTAVACPVGFRASGDKYAELAKVRYPLSDVVEFR
jgi:nitroreductase